MNTSDSSSTSLTAALSAARIPLANHDFIREITAAVGIDSYRFVDQAGKPYVVATRRDGLRPLHIESGATNGFYSEEEVARLAGDGVGRGLSGSRRGTWFVDHPVNKRRPAGGSRSRAIRREGTICETCGMQKPVTGECGNCD